MSKAIGVILIVLGLAGLAWGGFFYTTREKILDAGPIHATRDKTRHVSIPPILGALSLAGGCAMLVLGFKRG